LKANNITNNNPYNPAGRVTRGQMAAFLWREAGRQSISMPSASALVLWVNTAKGDRNVDLPLGAGNVTIDWGDGTAAETTAGSQVVRHTYATNGYYRIVITGTLAEFGGYDNANNYDLPELVAVPQFGNIGITSLGYSFTKAPNLARVSRNLPGVVDNLEGAFSTAVKANPCNPGAADWPQCLLNAQTASAENNYKRLYEYLGEDISQWDTSQIEDFSWMFAFEGEFNEDISGWDTSSATNMASMFLGAEAFNQDISGWDVSNVTNMQQMFENADAFNQDISGWDVSNVTNMLGMFTFTVAFQSDLSTWNISNVETFEMMFAHSPYNGSLAGWSFGQGTSLEAMFLGSTFNGDISSWDVSGVTSIKNMFQDATAFNQDLSSWQISGSSDRSNYDGGATSWVLPRPSIV
jgi:surface protein